MKKATKQINDETFLYLMNDLPLRKKIATLFMVQPKSIYYAVINKRPKLANPKVIALIKKHTGWSDEDIFKTQND